mgnify:CR=1 FL=1
MRTRSQVWAQKAYEKVREAAKGEGRGEYRDMALKLPVLVRQAGLSQALAFVDSRGKEAHKALGNHLAQVLGYRDLRELAEAAREAELPRLPPGCAIPHRRDPGHRRAEQHCLGPPRREAES